ncbi:MAG: polysaccharide biosynthesis C-terminal domain-containing protein [Sphaerochaetaceae bacterium]|nr:polysaccharide biosynthesis C-terminal domain-containing protein [Sphaerochaetaceae bacterium]
MKVSLNSHENLGLKEIPDYDTITNLFMSLFKNFLNYVLPSVLSFVLAGIYCFVDAFFVGNKVGDSGIAAINIAYSLIAFMQAAGSGIGIGASVRYSVATAQGKTEEASRYLNTSYILMTLAGIIISIPMLVFPIQLLELLGASRSIAELGKPYFMILAAGSLVQVFGTGFTPIVRNCGKPFIAMISMIAGLVINIILDWYFVWIKNLGLTGAAAASVIAEAIAFVICLVCLIGVKKIHLKCRYFVSYAKHILQIGLSPFGLTMIPNVSVIVMNRACLRYGGEQALGAYGCISYLFCIIALVIQGIDDGAQPLISTYYGRGDEKSLSYIKKLTMLFSMIFSLVSVAVCIPNGYRYGIFMGTSESVASIIKNGIVIFSVGIPCLAVSRTITSNFYASGENLKSYVISYIEPVFIFIFLQILPHISGQNGVWMANSAGQMCVMILAILLKRSPDKKRVAAKQQLSLNDVTESE